MSKNGVARVRVHKPTRNPSKLCNCPSIVLQFTTIHGWCVKKIGDELKRTCLLPRREESFRGIRAFGHYLRHVGVAHGGIGCQMGIPEDKSLDHGASSGLLTRPSFFPCVWHDLRRVELLNGSLDPVWLASNFEQYLTFYFYACSRTRRRPNAAPKCL